MSSVTLTRNIQIPDLARIARFERAPDIGPSVLFFSGGTAMNEISRDLKTFTHHSVHIMTPFDSGGSSAALRNAFDMPAVGDIRSRIMALADDGLAARHEIVTLFAMRLPVDESRKKNLATLKQLASGEADLVKAIKNPARRHIQKQLRHFLEIMPDDFPLGGACIGNLILASGYLQNGRSLDQVMKNFSRLVVMRGKVLPVIEDNLHLVARLENDDVISGQHLLTGKEQDPISAPVETIWLTKKAGGQKPVQPNISPRNRKIIRNADLICYPPGSFYSSLGANLLPQGVADAVASNMVPKVYFPGLGQDPETPGLAIADKVFRLLDHLHDCCQKPRQSSDLLNAVILDKITGQSIGKTAQRKLDKQGIQIVHTDLTRPKQPTKFDPRLFNMALLSMA